MRSTPTNVVRTTGRFTLAATPGGTWCAVEGVRLDGVDAREAVAEAAAFMRETRTRIASWWICERSTPTDVEQRLLAAGLRVVPDDYLIDGLLATTPPPLPPPGVAARPVANADEFVAATQAQYDGFGTPPGQRRPREELAAQYALDSDDVLYAAFLDGEIVAAARGTFARCGVLLTGGATLPEARGRGAYRALVRARWDDAVARGTPALAAGAVPETSSPILRALGFEQIVQFRRLQYDLPGA